MGEHKKTRIADCDVFVLAGGLGTRIRSVLGTTPKVLASIRGRAYLDLLMEWLARYGVRRVVFGLGHGASAVQDYLRNAGPLGMKVETSVEDAPLGTAGALRLARPRLETDPVLVMNGDGIVECNLDDLMAFHGRMGCEVTMVVTQVDDAARYGRVEIRDDRVAGFAEKDSRAAGRAFVNAGIYLFSRDALDRIGRGDAKSLERDVFARMAPGTIAAFVSGGEFLDIGTPESLQEANSATRRREFK